MFHQSSYPSTDAHDWPAPFASESFDPASQPPRHGIGDNDPLANLTPWKIYQRCIWVSDEDSNTKIMLLCVSRFMDKDLRASSMSYSQIARDCGFSEPTAKRCAKAVAGTWLTIGVHKGRYVDGKGHENLYTGRIPQRWADELRRKILGGVAVEPDEAIIEAVDRAMEGKSGVSRRHPDEHGVSGRHPENGVTGYQADTGVSGTLKRGITQTHLHLSTQKDRKGAAPPPPTSPKPTASANGKAAMAAALGGQAAFAASNIIISANGKITLGEEFRAELRSTYTDSQIERGMERAPAQAASTDPVKILQQIRRCCSYAKQDDATTEKRVAAIGKGAPARKTYPR